MVEREPGILFYLGLCLVIPSTILFAIARIQLGSSFQVSAEARRLVKTGIYKKLRHPIYLFGMLFLAGLILITKAFPLFLVLAILLVLQRNRIVKEEKVLAEKFGDEYKEYREQTWF
jgi:protein-S-isoprenylcysteine O-methyltransferase Ste14